MIRISTRLRVACTLVAAPLLYVALSSNSTGMTGVSASGCNTNGTCHGSSSPVTVLTISGIPTGGWVPGTAYSLVATISNNTKSAGGFDLSVNVGTLSNAPTGTSLNGTTEIYHTSPKSFSSGATSWTFTWTAPASGSTSLIVNFSGNAVNLSSTSTGDAWNSTTQTYSAAAVVPTAPTAVTNAATSVGTTTATLNGTVTANNASTAVSFEYGTTTAYGSTAVASPATIAAGTTATAVTGAPSGLTPNTLYHYRVKATNSAGTTNGADGTFTTQAVTTAPLIIMNPATNLSNTGATLNASVNANGTSTAVTLQYGLTTSYGSTAAVTPATVTGTSNTTVAAALTGLTKNTTYHYRFVATGNGTTNSPDATFSTTNLGVQDAAAAGIKLYPNPATDVVRIELAQPSAAATLWVFSTTGQRLSVPVQALGSGKYALDVSGLPAGGYWLLVKDGPASAGAAFQKR